MGEQDDLFKEMETMLREQIELHPDDLKPRLRLAKIHSQRRRTPEFLEAAHGILERIGSEDTHPARLHLLDMAKHLKIDLPKVQSKVTDSGGPRRRLGEDPASKQYFDSLSARYEPISANPAFVAEHDRNLIRNFSRPSPLFHLAHFSQQNGGAQIAIKREDMLGQGTRLVMAVAGQVLFAAKLGYRTVVCGGSNLRVGVVMCSIAARYGLTSMVYVSEAHARQHSAQLLQIRCFGGKVQFSAKHDSARDEAMDFCLGGADSRFMVLGVEAAPSPFDRLNTDLVSTIGREIRAQSNALFKRQPDLLVCRGKHTADAVGFFDPFLANADTKMVCVEALDNLEVPGANSNDPFHPGRTQQLSEEQLRHADAILEGSEFPSVQREHKRYKETGRVNYTQGSVMDARQVIKNLATLEGLVVPIRTSYPLGWAARHAKEMPKDQLIVVNMIEPSEKDLREVAKAIGVSDS